MKICFNFFISFQVNNNLNTIYFNVLQLKEIKRLDAEQEHTCCLVTASLRASCTVFEGRPLKFWPCPK
jgi:hypothetical protein